MLGTFLTSIPVALVGNEMIINNLALRTSLAIHHLISNVHSRENCEMKLILNCGDTEEIEIIAIQAIASFDPKKKFRASTGFEPMASALALQCSTN